MKFSLTETFDYSDQDSPSDASQNNPPEAFWGIRDFANMFEVTPRTIRFYEDKGLLSPKRDKNARIFDRLDYARFEKIMCAKRLGFTLDDIKEVLDVTDGRISSSSELLRRKRNFETVIRGLQRRREDIDNLSRDMAEICKVISRHVESVTSVADDIEVADLAAAYDAQFRRSLADDFGLDTPVPTTEYPVT
ncbi:MAG: MerR family transcriptional regulator [Litorimonas sp.]